MSTLDCPCCPRCCLDLTVTEIYDRLTKAGLCDGDWIVNDDRTYVTEVERLIAQRDRYAKTIGELLNAIRADGFGAIGSGGRLRGAYDAASTVLTEEATR